jgi:hypothetical protein
LDERWVEFSPPWAPHVQGRHTLRVIDVETGRPEAQRYEAKCGKCGAQWGPTTCETGMVRQHIATFARAHLHRDPLAPSAA